MAEATARQTGVVNEGGRQMCTATEAQVHLTLPWRCGKPPAGGYLAYPSTPAACAEPGAAATKAADQAKCLTAQRESHGEGGSLFSKKLHALIVRRIAFEQPAMQQARVSARASRQHPSAAALGEAVNLQLPQCANKRINVHAMKS